MKQLTRKNGFLTALVLTGCLAGPAARAAEGVFELVDNGAMERLDEKGRPLGWTDGAAQALKEANGNHFVRIVQRKPGQMTSLYRKAAIPGLRPRGRLAARTRHRSHPRRAPLV